MLFKRNFKVERPLSKVICISHKSIEELSKMFLRISEFYESMNPEYLNAIVTREQVANYYKSHGFDIDRDWAGFNIPGDKVVEFFKLYFDSSIELNEQEKELYCIIRDRGLLTDDFYLIGYWDGAKPEDKATDHELAHALYYLDAGYKESCQFIIADLYRDYPYSINLFVETLYDMGYSSHVIDDEIQAYMSTGTEEYFVHHFGSFLKSKSRNKFINNFKRYRE